MAFQKSFSTFRQTPDSLTVKSARGISSTCCLRFCAHVRELAVLPPCPHSALTGSFFRIWRSAAPSSSFGALARPAWWTRRPRSSLPPPDRWRTAATGSSRGSADYLDWVAGSIASPPALAKIFTIAFSRTPLSAGRLRWTTVVSPACPLAKTMRSRQRCGGLLVFGLSPLLHGWVGMHRGKRCAVHLHRGLQPPHPSADLGGRTWRLVALLARSAPCFPQHEASASGADVPHPYSMVPVKAQLTQR